MPPGKTKGDGSGMDNAVSLVMNSRLADLLERWRAMDAMDSASLLAALASHRDHLLLIQIEEGGFRYLHYGRAFVEHFGVDLTGQTITSLPADILSDDRRALLEFDYAFVQTRQMPLWRSYTADFGMEGIETWQRLVLPGGDRHLVVGAYEVDARPTGTEAERLLRLMIERVPAVLDRDGNVCDLALSLSDYSDTQRRAAEMEALANHDSLTGVTNLRHFHRLAGLELEHSRRMGRSLALLALDIDHFKRINDTWGHAAGDMALKAFATTCRAGLREPDILGRCGGEEFAIALPNTGLGGALIIAERLRKAVEDMEVTLPGITALRFTVSIGVTATGPGQGAVEDIVALLAEADRALYVSKKAGRNRVSLARSESAPPFVTG
jgi:diguanylate cyclase (GGDEF)-like protein